MDSRDLIPEIKKAPDGAFFIGWSLDQSFGGRIAGAAALTSTTAGAGAGAGAVVQPVLVPQRDEPLLLLLPRLPQLLLRRRRREPPPQPPET